MSGTIIEIPLSAAAISAINASSGFLVFGGRIANEALEVKNNIFGFTGDAQPTNLILTPIPEASFFPLVLVSLGLVFLRRRVNSRC